MEKKNSKSKNTAFSGSANRIHVLKTYKIYVDGKFPRTESGRYFLVKSPSGESLANMCTSSRKDFRDAVVAARKAQGGWAQRSAYNRGQILYRIAENLESRKNQFVEELILQGNKRDVADKEVTAAIDRLVHYAGWCDKYIQLFSSVNPVESSHFNFSVPEATGVVSVIAPEESSLIGLISVIAPAIAGGNTCVVLASGSKPLCAVSFAEVLHSSDVPSGVVNILTGFRKELLPFFASHMDVNAIVYCGTDREEIKSVQVNAALNVKRALILSEQKWLEEQAQSPYRIMDTQEIKTTWHPIGV